MDLKLFGGKTNFEMSKSKHLLITAKAYLSIGLPGGPSLQGRWYLSAKPWDLSDSINQQPLDGCTTPALPRHPVHLGQAHTLLRSAGQPEVWSRWTGKTPPAVKRVALGVRWGIQSSRMPGLPENS